MEKTFVVKQTKKAASKFHSEKLVLQGLFNGKKAMYISYGKVDVECGMIEVYSGKPGNKFLGYFEPEYFEDFKDAKGLVLIAV